MDAPASDSWEMTSDNGRPYSSLRNLSPSFNRALITFRRTRRVSVLGIMEDNGCGGHRLTLRLHSRSFSRHFFLSAY